MRKINTTEPSIHNSIVPGFIIVVLTFVSLTVLSLLQIQYFHNTVEEHSLMVEQTIAISNLEIVSQKRMDLIHAFIIETQEQSQRKEETIVLRHELDQLLLIVQEMRKILIETHLDSKEHNIMRSIINATSAEHDAVLLMLAAFDIGEINKGTDIMSHQVLPAHRTLISNILTMNDYKKTKILVTLKDTEDTKHIIQLKLVGITIFGCGFVLAIAVYLYSHISVTQSRLIEAKNAAEQLAQHDAMTGLPNRTFLRGRMEQAFMFADRESHLAAILMIDLNGFKQVNDTFGHQAGDELIIQVSHRLVQTMRQSDVVARVGGDEFAILLYKAESQRCAELAAERIIAAFYEPFLIHGQQFVVGASIGVALYPLHASSGETSHIDMLKHADAAMYQAKQAKVGYIVYSGHVGEKTEIQTLKTATMLAHLRKAVKNKEFVLYYQPKLNVITGKIDSAEALIRWRQPQLGLIRPDEFIPLAEKTGIIQEITMWIIEEGLHQLAKWKRNGVDISLSINVSPQCVNDTKMMKAIMDGLTTHKLSSDKLTVELTETAIMHNAENAIKVLVAMTSTGIKLSIDDFGTGHSSLIYLQKLPVSEIKIDKSFVVDLAEHHRNIKIVKSIIGLAHSIDCVVVAEGVETETDMNILKKLKCDYLQGYYISEPTSPEQIEKMVKENNVTV